MRACDGVRTIGFVSFLIIFVPPCGLLELWKVLNNMLCRRVDWYGRGWFLIISCAVVWIGIDGDAFNNISDILLKRICHFEFTNLYGGTYILLKVSAVLNLRVYTVAHIC